MSERVDAPFSEDQVRSLNEYQKSGVFHEFTCGTDNCREILIAEKDGWRCPVCGYRQYWAHPFMADWSWKQFPTMFEIGTSGSEPKNE